MYGCYLWLFTSVQWGHFQLIMQFVIFYVFGALLEINKTQTMSSMNVSMKLMVLVLLNSHPPKFSITTFAIKMSEMISESHCWQGLAIMWKWNFSTSNAHSRSFLQNLYAVEKWPRFSLCGSWIVYTKIDQHI